MHVCMHVYMALEKRFLLTRGKATHNLDAITVIYGDAGRFHSCACFSTNPSMGQLRDFYTILIEIDIII